VVQTSNSKRNWKSQKALGIGDSKLIGEAEALSHEVGKMLYSLLENLKS
jgi:hypothetical protein